MQDNAAATAFDDIREEEVFAVLQPDYSRGDVNALQKFEWLTYARTYARAPTISFSGRIFSSDADALQLGVQSPPGTDILSRIEQAKVTPKFIDFHVWTECTRPDCFLTLYNSAGQIWRMAIPEVLDGRSIDTDLGTISFTGLHRDGWVAGALVTAITKRIRVAQTIGQIYQKIGPLLAGLAALAYAGLLAEALLRRMLRPEFLLATVLLLMIGTRVVLLAYIDASAMPAVDFGYLSPLYPLGLAFCGVSIVAALPPISGLREVRRSIRGHARPFLR